MKKITLLAVGILLGLHGFSQVEAEPKVDSTKIRIGNSTIILVNRLSEDFDYDFGTCDTTKHKSELDGTLLIDIGTNGYMAAGNSLALPETQSLMELNYARSRSFGMSLMLKNAYLLKDRLYIAPGLGVTWNGYHFDNNIAISTSNDSTTFTLNTLVDNDKYKLRVTYLEIPLFIGAKFGKGDYPLGVQAGVITGLKIDSMIKQKFSEQGSKYKVKTKDDFNLQAFKFDLIARVSIGDVGLFARYALTTLFEENKAPELYPFAAGISFGGF